jgi:hypothetical protein
MCSSRNTVEENIKFETERVGFEPTDAFTSLVFKTRALNHSTTFPIEFQSPVYELYVVFLLPEKQDLERITHLFYVFPLMSLT